MSEKKELQELIYNISKGLKTYSVKELNEAIIQLLNKKGSKNQEINFIVDQVCNKYGITRRALFHSQEHGDNTEARRLCYCLLHDCLALSQRYIAIRLFKKSPARVNEAIRYMSSINLDISIDRKFRERYDAINMNFIKFINKNKE